MSVREITIDELKIALSSDAKVIDVRESDEYESGHVPNAMHLAHVQIRIRQIP